MTFIPSPHPLFPLSGVSIAIVNDFCVTMYSNTFNLIQTNSDRPVHNLLLLLTDGRWFVGLSSVKCKSYQVIRLRGLLVINCSTFFKPCFLISGGQWL